MLVTGGPGSGKTTLALLKAKRLIPALKPGQHILFLSFSRAAVRQVLIRCKDVLKVDERKRISVKTYHAFCMDLLSSHGRLLNGKRPRVLFPGSERLAESKFDGVWSTELQRLATEDGLYAFSTFANCTADLMFRSLSVRKLVTDTYPVIILDEFQDTDDAQWALVQQLACGSSFIALADPDQRIFEYQVDIDPKRLDQFRAAFSPKEFDLSDDNHRSPNAGILKFADAVMANTMVPATNDVQQCRTYSSDHDAAVHAAVSCLLSKLRSSGIGSPSVAVLCRSNFYVGEVSQMLQKSHRFRHHHYKPVDHHVVWDAELTAAAAQVVASILEWPSHNAKEGTAITLDAIADFYDMKYAMNPSRSAQRVATSYRKAACAVRGDKSPRSNGAKEIATAGRVGITFTGSPADDWRTARAILETSDRLREVFIAVRFVRLFHASYEIGGQLTTKWASAGHYKDARIVVRRTLELGRLLATEAVSQGVVLMTLHKSKGKEFDGVVIVEGRYAGTFFNEKREKPPFAATRRLLRVGITRARHHVVIVRPNAAPPLTGGRRVRHSST